MMNSPMKIIPVILCGGSGTRLWPMSREHYPKQLLKLASEFTLLQNTVKRLAGLTGEHETELGDPVFISNENHRFLIAEQLREIGIARPSILLEPEGKNTAPALTLAAKLIEKKHQDALMLVMPADHIISDVKSFHQSVDEGVALALENKLVTFGILPDHPETGFGYIKMGSQIQNSESARVISQFVEKPDLATAQSYIATGNYLWNSGMFIMKASIWNQAIEIFDPDIAKVCSDALAKGHEDMDFYRIDKESFSHCPNDSIDYAVMERVAEDNQQSGFEGAVVSLDVGWSDVGSWASLWDVSAKDDNNNVIKGDVLLDNTSSTMVIAEHRAVAVVGLDNVVIIETPDAVLVADKQSSQNVKNIVNQLKAKKRTEAVVHRQVYRPWGNYQGIDEGERFQVKRIVVSPGAQLSLQMHHHRAEHWVVVRGTAKVTKGDESFMLSENQSTYIPLGVVHRLENPGNIPLEIIEVQSGSYLGEDDIVRYEDQYGREGENG